MKIFNCDPEWPICLFDFAFKDKNPTYFCLRVASNLDSYINDGYFYGANSQMQQDDSLF